MSERGLRGRDGLLVLTKGDSPPNGFEKRGPREEAEWWIADLFVLPDREKGNGNSSRIGLRSLVSDGFRVQKRCC